MTIQEHVPLAPLTTMQVGGPARFFALARTEDEVREAVEYSRKSRLPLFVLGGGSNLVIADAGWPGLVLKVGISGLNRRPADNPILFEAGAGLDWDDFVAQTLALNCAGLECMSGIPGSVGGTPVQNVGAYGQEVSETIESVRALDLKENRVVVLSRQACGFRYRASIFNSSERGRYIILGVSFRLVPGGSATLKYADLQRHFPSRPQPSLAEVREAVLQIRRSKGMLIVPGDADCRNAGSFFKNPVLTETQFQDLTGRARAMGLQIPSYPALKTQKKVSAAWLVEHAGFEKGYELGPAGISRKHALAVVNTGAATANDILRLMKQIQDRVRDRWGVVLEPEPVFVGF